MINGGTMAPGPAAWNTLDDSALLPITKYIMMFKKEPIFCSSVDKMTQLSASHAEADSDIVLFQNSAVCILYSLSFIEQLPRKQMHVVQSLPAYSIGFSLPLQIVSLGRASLILQSCTWHIVIDQYGPC